MAEELFYITTPIYYVNDEPHIGHAYTTILADVLARYARLFGRETHFLVGTDEHGQKVLAAAMKRGVSPQAQADEMVTRFQGTWQRLQISFDDFIRTTEPRHRAVVQQILTYLWEQGDLYLGEYEGWYCVPDERFWTDKDVTEAACPDCGRPLEWLTEANYFFRMGRYQQWLNGYITNHPEFIQPPYRRNEVLGFLRSPLADLCISRPVSRMDWGIRLPFDDRFVTYVWFDALLNYVTGAGYLSDPVRFQELWPQATHIIGKDILITHCVYWPTMLKAAGLPQPHRIYAHGWWILSGQKISKSRGNTVRPLDLIEIYGVDSFRYFLIREMSLGRDAEFNELQLADRYEKELANDLGNLLNRLTAMIEKYCQGRIPAVQDLDEAERSLMQKAEELVRSTDDRIRDLAINDALFNIMSYVREINRYLEITSPWKMASEGQTKRLDTVLYTAMEALRLASVLLGPVMPEKMADLLGQIGCSADQVTVESRAHDRLLWGRLVPGTEVKTGKPLFPKDALTSRTSQA